MTADHESALMRFAADVARLGGDNALVAAYRAALARAGVPDDRAWAHFACALRRFVAHASARTRNARDAAARLSAILIENADLA